jgi:hypothetical protein
MINCSSSFLFRTKCKWCFSPPQKYRVYSNLHFPTEDIIKAIKEEQEYRFIEMLPIDGVNDLLKFREKDKIKMIYFSLACSGDKNIKPSYYQKYKNSSKKINKNNLPKFASCQCGLSYWIDWCISDPEIYPQCNRKSSYKIALKPMFRRKR